MAPASPAGRTSAPTSSSPSCPRACCATHRRPSRSCSTTTRCSPQTLETFLEAAGDIKETSARLHLHRSSVYNRLEKLTEVTGLDLQRGDDRLLAHLVIRLRRLR